MWPKPGDARGLREIFGDLGRLEDNTHRELPKAIRMSPRQAKRNSRADPRFFAPRVNLFGALGKVIAQAHSKNLVLALQQTYLTRRMWSPWPTA